MKTAGMVILLFMSVAVGCLAAHGLKRRVELLRAIRRMIESMRLMIRYEALETDEIIKRLAEDSSMSELTFINEIADEGSENCFHDKWESAVKTQSGLNDEDILLLLRIGSFLGTSDCEGQNSALEVAAAETDRLIEEAAGQYEAKGRLYRSLGAAAGALLAVIAV